MAKVIEKTEITHLSQKLANDVTVHARSHHKGIVSSHNNEEDNTVDVEIVSISPVVVIGAILLLIFLGLVALAAFGVIVL